MAHMQKQITERMRGWAVHTADDGVFYIPNDVVNVPKYLKTGGVIQKDGDSKQRGDLEVLDVFRTRLRAYVEGNNICAVEVLEGYFARWSAPGYLDCTSWTFGRTLRDALKALASEA